MTTQTSGAAFSAGKPVRLLHTKYATPRGILRSYDVSTDDRRFLMLKDIGDPGATPARMIVVVNWLEELKKQVPVK